jgi:hypothetical protein
LVEAVEIMQVVDLHEYPCWFRCFIGFPGAIERSIPVKPNQTKSNQIKPGLNGEL